MSVNEHRHPRLLQSEVDVGTSVSRGFLRFAQRHLCLNWNEDNKLDSAQVDPVLIYADLNVARSETVFYASDLSNCPVFLC